MAFKLRWWHVLIVAILLAWYFGYISFPVQVTPPSGKTPAPAEFYFGTMTVKISETNAFDGSSETTTNPVYTAYQGHLGPGVGGVAISASGTDFDLAKESQGILYMKLYAGDAHYPDVSALQRANPRIKEVSWRDLDNNGVDELIARIDASDIGERGQALKPVLTVVLPLVDEDVAGITTDSPANIASVGTTEVVKQITWKVSGVSEKAGFSIIRLWFSTNETREGTDIKLEELSLSGLGVDKTISTPAYVYDGPTVGDYSAWYWKPADYNDWHNGIFVSRAVAKADAMYVTLNVRCSFETGDALFVQLELEYISAEGTVSTLQDKVELSA